MLYYEDYFCFGIGYVDLVIIFGWWVSRLICVR